MNATDLCFTPATRLAEMIRTKAVSPVEVTRAVLERVARLNPTLNAFCTLLADQAMDQARAAEEAVMQGRRLGPLHGVPYSIKEPAMTQGVRTMGASYIYEHRVPDRDAPFVARLRAAGGIFLGKTTTPEFGWEGRRCCPLTGAPRNPWNTPRTTRRS